MTPSFSLIALASHMADKYFQSVPFPVIGLNIVLREGTAVDQHNSSLDFLSRVLSQCSILSEEDREIIEEALAECELIFV
jgi:hypothetical protein